MYIRFSMGVCSYEFRVSDHNHPKGSYLNGFLVDLEKSSKNNREDCMTVFKDEFLEKQSEMRRR